MFTMSVTAPLGSEFMLEKLRVQCDAAEATVTAGAIALSSTVALQIPLGDISEITSMF